MISSRARNAAMLACMLVSGACGASRAQTRSDSLARAFGIDRPARGCGALTVYASDAARTRVVSVWVDLEALRLGPGHHTIELGAPDPHSRVELVRYEAPSPELPFCTDVMSPQPDAVERWTATRGQLELDLPATTSPGEPFEVHVRLRNVAFEGPRVLPVIDADLGTLTAGWLPG